MASSVHSFRRLVAGTLALLAFPSLLLAADLTGKWRAAFDTQIGRQTYLFELHETDGRITGKAIGERGGVKDEVVLTEGRLADGEVFFVESLPFEGQTLRIEYRGRLKGDDELALSRKVADFVTEQLVATRVKTGAR